MRKLTTTLGMLVATVMAVSATAGTLAGKVTDTTGKAMEGVMIRLTNADNISESVYTNAEGNYELQTRLQGELKLRSRSPYFRDSTGVVELAANAAVNKDLQLVAMTGDREISESLPAAYHFGNLPFEQGDDKDFNRYQFQRDCLSCHQMGNSFTRVPRSAKSWAQTVHRMHLYLGNFDMKLRDARAEIFAKGFDGKPLTVRPEFPLAKELATAKIYEYPLLNRGVPHDAIAHENGMLYTVDQSLDHMSITDPVTGMTEYIPQKGSDSDKYRTADGIANYGPNQRHGPHSLDLGNDGKYYVTNTGSTSIGVFNPATDKWEASHQIDPASGAVYPHSIRVNKAGIVWFTLAGSEKVGRLDPVSGKFTIIDLPSVAPQGISAGTQPYGIDINPLDDSMWYGRLFGDKVGRIDPETLEPTEFDSPVRGPRRMHFDKKGILWVTGYSEGTLARIDPNGFKTKVYDMPEYAPGYRPAPYALGVHPDTQDIWINENMTDRFFRFIPDEERWVAYPIPLTGTYTRDVTFTRDGKVCTSNNPLPAPALEGGVLQIFCIDTDYTANAAGGLAFSK
jgi:streptogramin lyase|tara:strand:- start:10435 stop:12132 length:1698 start_codon:yes stop_codon:yes gene_type:complete